MTLSANGDSRVELTVAHVLSNGDSCVEPPSSHVWGCRYFPCDLPPSDVWLTRESPLKHCSKGLYVQACLKSSGLLLQVCGQRYYAASCAVPARTGIRFADVLFTDKDKTKTYLGDGL